MTILRVLLLVVEAVCAALLIGVILLQKSKGEGLGVAFGAGMGESLFGSRAGNVLTKITITLGVTFLVTTTLLAVITTTAHDQSLIDERVADVPVAPAAPPPSEAAPPGSGLESIPFGAAPAAAPAEAAPAEEGSAPAPAPAPVEAAQEAPASPATP